jgi:hypothetical protein
MDEEYYSKIELNIEDFLRKRCYINRVEENKR